MFCVVWDFLSFFDLDFTASVYEAESCMGSAYKCSGRSELMKDLGITGLNENVEGPLLLQLIRLVQLCNNTPRETEKVGDVKTDMLAANCETSVSVLEPKVIDLNATFDLSNPKIIVSNGSDHIDSVETKNEEEHKQVNGCSKTNETLNETSTNGTDDVEGAEASEASLALIDLQNSVASNEEQILTEEDCVDSNSSSVQKETKLSARSETSGEKFRLPPQKSDRFKSKSVASSLADSPPMPLNKNESMILPSLYSHEFKEKPLKELDELGLDLDPLDNYEEDFMSASEVELSTARSKTAAESEASNDAKAETDESV